MAIKIEIESDLQPVVYGINRYTELVDLTMTTLNEDGTPYLLQAAVPMELEDALEVAAGILRACGYTLEFEDNMAYAGYLDEEETDGN